MKTYAIHPIPLVVGGTPLFNKTYRQSYGGATIPSCCFIWYIEGANEHILIDSGVNAEMLAAHGLMARRDIQSVEAGLSKLDLEPEDIDIVIQTQLHFDHVAFAHKFSKAKFLIQKAELDFSLSPPPMFASYPELFQDLDIETIEGDHEVEDGIKLLFTPGHTPGGQSVAVHTTEGLAVIDGLCSCDENFYPGDIPKNPPVIAPTIHTDLIQAYNSLLKIKELADIIIPQHEARFAFVDRVPSV